MGRLKRKGTRVERIGDAAVPPIAGLQIRFSRLAVPVNTVILPKRTRSSIG